MSEANKVLIRRFYDHVWNKAEYLAARDLVAPDYLCQAPQPIRGRGGIRDVAAQVRAAFPDLFISIEDLLSEGDRVAVRWHASESTAAGRSVTLPRRAVRPRSPGSPSPTSATVRSKKSGRSGTCRAG